MLKDRTRDFLRRLPVNVSAFCREISLSRSALYQWLRGDLRLSAASEKRIDHYLTELGF